jgi:translation initiation factor IF-2
LPPKKIVNLVKALGGISIGQVMALLEKAGFDTQKGKVSVLTSVDGATYERVVEIFKKEGAPPVEVQEEAPAKGKAAKPRRITRTDGSAEKEKKVPSAPGAKPKAGQRKIMEEEPKSEVNAKRAKKGDVAASEKTEEEKKGAKKGRAAAVVPELSKTVRKKAMGTEAAAEDERVVVSKKRFFKVKGVRGAPAKPTVVPFLKITGEMSIREVSVQSGIKVGDIIGFLLRELDIMATINYVASIDEIGLICEHFGVKYEVAPSEMPEDSLDLFTQVETKNLVPRPPVVTIMGHVDHGKTRLLDTIRKTNVAGGEAGGITQHIGAYQITIKGKKITFLDTPGHEAFTSMRARGSQVTDIVVLVVAADDGVKPQTIEAIDHAKAAKVPIIVAVNKIDRVQANPDLVKQQLSEYGLVPEDWGGDTVFVPISALRGDNIDDLLEMILITADILDLKADPAAPPYGVVVESQVDAGIGVVATVLVNQGTMRRGQFIIAGTSIGRIKRMEDENARELESVPPGSPARIIGFTEPPENGDKVYAFNEKKKALEIVEARLSRQRVSMVARPAKVTLDDLFTRIKEGEMKELRIVCKADVQGTAEALKELLGRIDVEGVKVNIVRLGVGQITETDVMLAAASDAIVIGFQTTISHATKRLAEREHVDVRLYDIIYQISDDIEKAMKGLREPTFVEVALGRLEVRKIFKTDKTQVVCGGYVLDGKATRGSRYRLRRNGDTIVEGALNSLKRFKDDVREVGSGYECGFLLENVSDVKEGDILELFRLEKVEEA